MISREREKAEAMRTATAELGSVVTSLGENEYAI
jgi:hypothetical protein